MHDKNTGMNLISRIVLRNIIVIVIFALVFGVIGGIYAKRKKHTVYEAERSLMIDHSYRGAGANEEVQADINLGKTFAKIAESKDVAQDAHKKLSKSLKKDYSIKSIDSMVDAHPVMQTTIVKIKVRAKSAKAAAAITNAVTEASAQQIAKKVPSTGRVTPFAKVSSDEAQSITTPSIKKYTLLGGAIGFLLGMIIAFSVTTWTKLV